MGILSSILLNNRNKPVSKATPYAVKRDRENRDKKIRATKAKNAKQMKSTLYGGASPVLLQGVTFVDNRKLTPNEKKAKELANGLFKSSSGGSGGSSSGGSGGGSSGSGGSGGSSSDDAAAKAEEKRKKRLVKAFDKMKDSNIPYTYKIDENDLMHIAASEKQDDYWQFKEELFLYTVHDRKKHRYITGVQIDSDKNDIVTSCQIDMPYDSKLMEYWIPGKTAFMVMGGTFDREVLFIGRVSEVNQLGDSIQVIGQNIGWKFKQYMSESFYKKIEGLPVTTVVKAIFNELKFSEGKYYIDLWGIPNIDKYVLDENATITCDGETVQNVPELTDVVKRMQDSDINKYVATHSKVRDTETVIKDYNKQVKMQTLDSVVDSSKSYMPSSLRQSFGVSTTVKNGELEYNPLMDRILGKDKRLEYFTEDASGDSEYTYEDILHNIASAIDAHFYIVDTTVCFVSFNALMAMGGSLATQKAIQPTIEFWQLQDESYEVDINQYGYYNTVIIKYKNGTLKRSFDDLVRVYGEVPITYNEPNLNYEGAQLKAQAYLAAHVRDFGMELRATILYTGKIIPSSFIKVLNPLTMSESLLYVFGTSIHWEADGQTLTCDLDLRYGPENPDNPEVPEVGLGYSSGNSNSGSKIYSGNVSADVASAAQQMIMGAVDESEKAERIYGYFAAKVGYRLYYNSEHGISATLRGVKSNCYDTCWAAYNVCTAAGVRCEFWHGTLYGQTGTWGHYWLKMYHNGKMEIADLGRGDKKGLGNYSGKLVGSCQQKNY